MEKDTTPEINLPMQEFKSGDGPERQGLLWNPGFDGVIKAENEPKPEA